MTRCLSTPSGPPAGIPALCGSSAGLINSSEKEASA